MVDLEVEDTRMVEDMGVVEDSAEVVVTGWEVRVDSPGVHLADMRMISLLQGQHQEVFTDFLITCVAPELCAIAPSHFVIVETRRRAMVRMMIL
jgi:hypothetical protein